MKVLFLTLLLVFAAIKADDPATDAASFVNGILNGGLGLETGKVNNECITDGDIIIADSNKLITDSTTLDITLLASDVEALLTHIPTSIKTCEQVPQSVFDTLATWKGKVQDPSKVKKIAALAVLFHKKALEKDAHGFLDNWSSGAFETSGQFLGDALHIGFDVIGTQNKTVTPIDVGHFLDGFLTAALQSEVTEIGTCITDSDELLEKIEYFVNYIDEGIDELAFVGQVRDTLLLIPETLKDCVEFKDDVGEVLKKWNEELYDPLTIFTIMAIAFTQYKDRLMTDVDDFASEWNAEHFELSGSKLGDFAYVLLDLSLPKSNSISAVEALMKGYKF